MRCVCVVQARMGSRRFPGKVLADLCGRPVLAHVVERCQAIPGIDQVVLTIPRGAEDDPLERWATAHGIMAYRNQVPLAGTGANDCLAAYHETAEATHADVVVRVTSDCPLLDSRLAGEVLERVVSWRTLFASNCQPVRTYPDGLDVEAFTMGALKAVLMFQKDSHDHEHVTPGMSQMLWDPRTPLETENLQHDEDLSMVRWTIDCEADLAKLRRIVAYLPAGAFTLADTRKAAEEAGCWP